MEGKRNAKKNLIKSIRIYICLKTIQFYFVLNKRKSTYRGENSRNQEKMERFFR